MNEPKSRGWALAPMFSRRGGSWPATISAKATLRGAGCTSMGESAASPDGRPPVQPLNNLIAEGERLMVICNACRYCEGYCAVFPAMERRLSFSAADLNYLANLCHNCAECYYSCQ